jgi:YD repeat-containing protein
VLSGVSYEPFGPVSEITYGNGVKESRQFDLDYSVTRLADEGTHSLQNLSYSYDADDHVSSITDNERPGNSQTFVYDLLNRLVNASGAYGVHGYR